MYGYDTLVAAWPQPSGDAPRSIFLGSHPWEAAPWDTNTRDEVSGAIKRTMSIPGWCQFTYVRDPRKKLDEYRVQCSLPKLLYKTNTKTLPMEDVPAALVKLDRMVRLHFPGAPSVAEMIPRRVDATADKDLGDELLVASVLHRLRDRTYRGRRPWVGDKGTINWSGKTGGHRNRVYAKFAESAEEEGRGILRVEREAKGLSVMRDDYSKVIALAEQNGDLTVGQVLYCPGVAQVIVAPLESIVDSAMKEDEELQTEEVFLRLMKDGKCSLVRAATIIGYVAVVQRVGWDNLGLPANTKYEARKSLRLAGIEVAEVQFTPWEKKVTETKPLSSAQARKLGKKQAAEETPATVQEVLQ